MKFSEFKSSRTIVPAIDLKLLRIYHPLNNKIRQLVADNRSFKDENDLWHVYPIGFHHRGNQLFIVCPFCGDIHGHSNEPGHRVSHCKTCVKSYYYVEDLPGEDC